MVQKETTCSNKWQWSHLNEAAQTSGEVLLFCWGSLWAREHKQIQWVFMWTLAPLPPVTWSPGVTKKGGQLHSKAVLPAGVLILALAHTTAAWELLSFFWVVPRICSKNHQEFIWTNNQEDTTSSRLLYFPSLGVNSKKLLITNSLLSKWILFTRQEFETTEHV